MSTSNNVTNNGTSIGDAINDQTGTAQSQAGISWKAFSASLAVSVAVFAIEFLLFVLIKNKLARIYQPRTYLVPERERTKPSPPGLLAWIYPVFKTSNSEFIQKCGLDAYFFLRFLRMLLKIFVPLALLVIPILIPTNKIHGRGPHFSESVYGKSHNGTADISGLDLLAWGNVAPNKTNRYWAHFVLAVVVIVWSCYVFFDELRGYIRLRQAYLTSPQHRLRASATTVLVSAIPRKWLSYEALDGLYDVFPGGIRNIWINRNFDELQEKVKLREDYARRLEVAETELVKKCMKAQLKIAAAEAKKAGRNAKKDVKNEQAAASARGNQMAQDPGISSGDPHQVKHNVDEALHGRDDPEAGRQGSDERERNKLFLPVPIIGDGIGAVTQGIGNLGKTVLGGLKKVGNGVDDRFNTTGGFVASDDLPITRQDDRIADGVSPAYRVNTVESAAPGRLDPYRGRRPAEDESHGDTHPALRTVSNASTVRPSGSHEDPGSARFSTSEYDKKPLPPAPGSGVTRPENDTGTTHGALSWKGKIWKRDSKTRTSSVPASARREGAGDEYPLTERSPVTTEGTTPPATSEKHKNRKIRKPELKTHGSAHEGDIQDGQEYPVAINEDFDEDDEETWGVPLWKEYIKGKDRDTMRLPIFGWNWMISLPLVGEKVDVIRHCRKELARLNVEIEQDQQEPEKFPLMNSAFIQFNHQVAAHMACQAVSHHLPKQMAPRVVEISPDDIIWDNMSIKWWERYLRTFGVIVLVCGMVIAWGFPVAFTGLLSQLSYLEAKFAWLRWLQNWPPVITSAIQGVLPPVVLGILMALLPLILRYLSKAQGLQTGMAIELAVQRYFFAFLFVQLFLVVTISSGISATLKEVTTHVQNVPAILATNIPKASNYFFSYMILQALTVSAGALVQIFGLVGWFILAPLLDNTARKKWARTTNLSQMQWGTFFPVYANLACIGLIYSVIAPLILFFNIITFSLFWFVHRYNTLYVTKFRFDTGGLLFPKAINQLFTGIYVMELCLIGLFFLVRDENDNVACKGQAIAMIVVGILTIGFQILLNEAFAPLFRYLPITLEDDAVRRDEEFARAQGQRLGLIEGEREGDNLQDALEEREKQEREDDRRREEQERKMIEGERKERKLHHGTHLLPAKITDNLTTKITNNLPRPTSWADRSRNHRSSYVYSSESNLPTLQNRREVPSEIQDPEAQAPPTKAIGQALFAGIHDELEDLTPDERDQLVQRAFRHEALRVKRPVIWIPRDDLGVSDDEIYRTQRESKHIWISNEYQGLDGKGRCIFSRSPPDFSEVDLIQL